MERLLQGRLLGIPLRAVQFISRPTINGKATEVVSLAQGVHTFEGHGEEDLVAEFEAVLPDRFPIRIVPDERHRHKGPQAVDDQLAR